VITVAYNIAKLITDAKYALGALAHRARRRLMLDIKLGPALLKIFNGQTLEKFLRSVSDEEEKFYKIST
jgi:hypothetical protein